MCVIIALIFAIHSGPVKSVGQCLSAVSPLAVKIKHRSVGSWTDLPKITSQVSDRAEIETHVLCNCHISLLPTASWVVENRLTLSWKLDNRVSCFSFACPASSVISDRLAILCLKLSVGEILLGVGLVVKPFSC